MLPTILFYIVAVATAAAAVGVAVSQSVIRAATFLLLTLIGVSLVFFLLGAEFLGAAQLIVYVGGTLVLVVFGGMLTSGGPYSYFPTVRRDYLLAGGASIGLFLLLVGSSIELGRSPKYRFLKESQIKNDQPATTGSMGLSFLGFTKANQPAYLLPFELVSVHLLVVLIGAAYLARAKSKPRTDSADMQKSAVVKEPSCSTQV